MAAHLSPLLVYLLVVARRRVQPTAHDAAGATMVEYAIMLAAIAAVAVAAVTALGQDVIEMFEGVLPGFN